MASPSKSLESAPFAWFERVVNEIDIVRDVSRKFEQSGIDYMLTGSMAMNYYAQPRMTRDIDVVVAIKPNDVERVVALFEPEYYVSKESIRESIEHESIFNLIHHESVIKVDCIVRKQNEYRKVESRAAAKDVYSRFHHLYCEQGGLDNFKNCFGQKILTPRFNSAM